MQRVAGLPLFSVPAILLDHWGAECTKHHHIRGALGRRSEGGFYAGSGMKNRTGPAHPDLPKPDQTKTQTHEQPWAQRRTQAVAKAKKKI
jgi:hypothetical protein